MAGRCLSSAWLQGEDEVAFVSSLTLQMVILGDLVFGPGGMDEAAQEYAIPGRGGGGAEGFRQRAGSGR